MLIALGEIESELNAKKYGLVWEKHEEAGLLQKRHSSILTLVCSFPLSSIDVLPDQKALQTLIDQFRRKNGL